MFFKFKIIETSIKRCTCQFVPKVSKNLALSIAGQKEIGNLHLKHWSSFFESLKVSTPFYIKQISEKLHYMPGFKESEIQLRATSLKGIVAIIRNDLFGIINEWNQELSEQHEKRGE